jgi:hypothetical protein
LYSHCHNMSVMYLFHFDSLLYIVTINRLQDEFTEYSHYKTEH